MDPSQDASYQRLIKIEWCAKLLNDPAWRIALNKTSSLPPEYGNRFFGKTLRTEDTIRAIICLYKIYAGQVSETLILFELGGGAGGLPGVVHGGMTATMLDEACGIFAASLIGPDVPALLEAWDNHGCAALASDISTATLYLNITYLKFIKEDAVVAVRSRLKQRKGRKLYVQSQVEDQHGNVLAKGDALFLARGQPTL